MGTHAKCWWEKSSCNRFSDVSSWCVQQRESGIIPKQHNDLCAVIIFEGQGDIAVEPVHMLLVR